MMLKLQVIPASTMFQKTALFGNGRLAFLIDCQFGTKGKLIFLDGMRTLIAIHEKKHFDEKAKPFRL